MFLQWEQCKIALIAQKAEEYGSHPTTFELVITGTATVLMSHECEDGDI